MPLNSARVELMVEASSKFLLRALHETFAFVVDCKPICRVLCRYNKCKENFNIACNVCIISKCNLIGTLYIDK